MEPQLILEESLVLRYVCSRSDRGRAGAEDKSRLWNSGSEPIGELAVKLMVGAWVRPPLGGGMAPSDSIVYSHYGRNFTGSRDY